MLARYQQRALERRREIRLARQRLGGRQAPHVGHAIFDRLRLDRAEARGLLLRPGDDHGTRLEKRQIEPGADRHVFAIARPHAFELQAPRRCVEAGVEEGAVRLACPGEDVAAALQERHLGAIEGEAPRHGAADHAAADHDDVERRASRRLLGHGARLQEGHHREKSVAIASKKGIDETIAGGWPAEVIRWMPLFRASQGPTSPQRGCAGSPISRPSGG
jgi:hypothetical protein